MCGDLHEHFVRRRLGVFDEYVEVAIVIEHAGVQELELRLSGAAASILLEELRIRERSLRIFVEHLQVRMARCGVQVVVQLLHILAVIAFGVREAEKALLQNRVPTVPQRQG